MTPQFRITIAPLVAVLAAAAITTPAIARPIESATDRPYGKSPAQHLRMSDTIDVGDVPNRVDAAAHAATIRAIGARMAERPSC